ncbi:MAG: PAS domain-containing sensor histidine kinase, partial [Cytophagales bacterium]|nr:PAS domain-containing sensor histidine kinase [Cytophagales bacterium]
VNGNVIHFNGEDAICSTLLDITERKRSEEALRNSEAKIASLINNTMDFILSVDKNFHITAMNDPLKNVLFQSTGEDDFTGASMFDIIPKDRHKSTLENFNEVLQGKKVVVEHLILLQSEGEIQYVEDSYNPIKNEKGEVEGISIFTRDITERRISEIQLKNTLKELKERNFELDTFVYKVSHDLRAPLRSVLGLVNLMKMNKEAETQKLCVEKIEESMERMDSFIQTVLVYSRTLNNGIEYRKINFKSIIKECIDELKYTKDSELLKVSVDLEGTVDFFNDYFRLTIIFKNFISNAIKYLNRDIPENTLKFKIKVTKESAVIEIRDNGIGMEESVKEKIFEMFYRGTERSDSSGLGLYIVKLNIEKLNGGIDVESKPGIGTTFHIRLPNKIDIVAS